MILFSVFLLLTIQIAAMLYYKDYTCPAVLHNVMWILALLGAITYHQDQILPVSLVVIVAGSVLFQISFWLSQRIHIRHRRPSRSAGYLIPNFSAMKALIIASTILAVPYLLQYYMYLRSSNQSIYTLLRKAEENLSLPGIIPYYRRMVQNLSLAFLTAYWLMKKQDRRAIRYYVWTLFALAMLCMLSVPTRNGMLAYLLPLIILYILTHNISRRQILLLGLLSLVGFMGIFYAISLQKYWYMYNKSKSAFQVLLEEIQLYLSGGVVSFGRYINNHAFMYEGKNFFRMFMVLGDRLFGTSTAVRVVNAFETISGNSTGNVFTFYDFYLRDYGIFFALLAQTVVGCLHGIAYKGTRRGDMFHMYMLVLLTYPLVMQFFQDQYWSLLSTWIQIIIVGIVVFKTKLFFKPASQEDIEALLVETDETFVQEEHPS